VAASLLHGRLDPEDLSGPALAAWSEPLLRLAERVSVSLDRGAARDLFRELGVGSGMWQRLRRRGVVPLARGIAAAVRAAPGVAGARDGSGVRWDLAGLAGVLGRAMRADAGTRGARPYDMAFPFGAEVIVHLRGGARLSERVAIPDGAAGSGLVRLREVAREKLVRHGAAWASAEDLQGVADELLDGRLDAVPVSEVVARVRPAGRPELEVSARTH
jgi:hypothetical protein